jgi:hypothetical protein
MDASIEGRIDVYDGVTHIGAVRQRNRLWHAEDGAGAAIATFSDRPSAVAAVIAHYRAGTPARLAAL